MFDLILSFVANPGALPIIILLGLLCLALVPLLIMWLWNNTLPELFGFKTIRYWQSFRLYLLFALLIGHFSLFNIHYKTDETRHYDSIDSAIPQSISRTESWFYGIGGGQ